MIKCTLQEIEMKMKKNKNYKNYNKKVQQKEIKIISLII